MRWVRWTQEGPRFGGVCTQCDRRLHNGDMVLVQNTTARTKPELYFHPACVQAILDTITDTEARAVADGELPPDSSEIVEFYALRDRIAATGRAFPDPD